MGPKSFRRNSLYLSALDFFTGPKQISWDSIFTWFWDPFFVFFLWARANTLDGTTIFQFVSSFWWGQERCKKVLKGQLFSLWRLGIFLMVRKKWSDSHLPMNVFRWGQEVFEGSAFSLTPCFFWWCQKGYAGTTIFLFVLFPSDGGQGEFEGTNFPCLLWRNKKSDQIRYILMNVLTNFPIKFDQVFVLFLLWVCFGKNIRIYIYMYLF